MLLEDGLRLDELVDLGVVEAALVHDLPGVLAAHGRRAPNALWRAREVNRLAEVLEAAELGVLLVHDELMGSHVGVVVDTAPEVVVAELAGDAVAVEGLATSSDTSPVEGAELTTAC